MSKALKYTGIVIGIIIAIFIILAIILSQVLSPKTLIKQLDSYLVEKTGQHLVVKGKSGLSFFPWLGFNGHDITITSPKGFDKPLAQIGDLQVKVKLMPLLSGDVRIGRVVMKEATFNLITDKTGKTNWQGLANLSNNQKAKQSAQPKTKTKQAAKAAAPIALSIAKIDIQNANIISTNLKTKETSRIQRFNLETGGIDSFDNIAIKASLQSSSSKSKTVNHVNFSGTLHVNPETKTFKMDNFSLENQSYSGKRTGANINVTGHLNGDMSKQAITLNKMRISVANLVLSGKAKIAKFMSRPVYSINFASNKVSISKLSRTLTGRSGGSGSLKISANITTSGSTQRSIIKNMRGSGKFSVTGLSLGNKVNSYIDKGISSSKRGRGKVKRTSGAAKSISLWGSFTLKNGILYNPRLSTSLKNPKVYGGGRVNLLTQRINYTLQASTVLRLPPNHNIPIKFPIYVTGTLSNPQIKPDTGKIAGQIAAYFIKNILNNAIKGAIQGKTKGRVPISIPIFGR